MNPTDLPFDSEAMLAGLRAWVECESPTWDAAAVEPHARSSPRAKWRSWARAIERIAGRQGFGGCVRAKLPASEARRARHPDRRPSRYGSSPRHASRSCSSAATATMLRPRHLRHEGRQLPRPRSDPATGACRLHHAASDHRAVHPGRGSRHALGARSHRGRSRAQQIRAGARTRPRRTTASSPGVMRSRASTWKPRASQAMPAQPFLRPFGHPRDGAAHHGDRRHDVGGLHLLASASCMAANGSIASPPPAPARR